LLNRANRCQLKTTEISERPAYRKQHARLALAQFDLLMKPASLGMTWLGARLPSASIPNF
jgi:hypothetical protein